MGFSKEPAVWTAAILAILEAGVALLVLFDVVNWSVDQVAGIIGFGSAILTAVAAVIIVRPRVTPLADPQTADGRPATLTPR